MLREVWLELLLNLRMLLIRKLRLKASLLHKLNTIDCIKSMAQCGKKSQWLITNLRIFTDNKKNSELMNPLTTILEK